MVKDTDEHLNEKIHRVRPGGVPSAENSVPREMGTFWGVDVYTNLETLQTSYSGYFYGGFIIQASGIINF